MIVKLGKKGKHVRIPDGWFIVTNGVCKVKDKFFDLGSKIFRTVEHDDVGLEHECFDLLIRKEDDN